MCALEWNVLTTVQTQLDFLQSLTGGVRAVSVFLTACLCARSSRRHLKKILRRAFVVWSVSRSPLTSQLSAMPPTISAQPWWPSTSKPVSSSCCLRFLSLLFVFICVYVSHCCPPAPPPPFFFCSCLCHFFNVYFVWMPQAVLCAVMCCLWFWTF